MGLKATVNFTEPNEPLSAVKVDVWVNSAHRGQVALNGDVRSYVIESLAHNDTVWVEVTYVDTAGNASVSERLVFQATDVIPPAAPVVTLAVVEQV